MNSHQYKLIITEVFVKLFHCKYQNQVIEPYPHFQYSAEASYLNTNANTQEY